MKIQHRSCYVRFNSFFFLDFNLIVDIVRTYNLWGLFRRTLCCCSFSNFTNYYVLQHTPWSLKKRSQYIQAINYGRYHDTSYFQVWLRIFIIVVSKLELGGVIKFVSKNPISEYKIEWNDNQLLNVNKFNQASNHKPQKIFLVGSTH